MIKLFNLLLISLIVKQLVWTVFIPLWQFPDEQAHFAQIAYFVEVGKWGLGANLTKEILLSERILQTERDWAGNNKFTYHPEYNIEYSDTTSGLKEAEIVNFPIRERSQLVKEEATFYPPLYYFPGKIVYSLFYQQNLFIRVFIARLLNLVYFCLLAVLAFKLFRLVFNDNLFALCGVTILTYQPMFSFVSAGVNSDNLFNLLFLASIYVSLRIIKKGINIKGVLFAVIIYLLALYTKPQSQIIILIYLFPLIYNIIRYRLRKIAYLTVIISVSILALLIINQVKGNRFLPDVNYTNITLGDLPIFLNFLIESLKHGYKEVLPWYWGVFRWLSFTLPRLAYRLINLFSLVLVIGVLLFVNKKIRKREFSFKIISLGFLLYVSVLYFLIITTWNYLFVKNQGFSFGIQGRYFFPTISAHIGILLFGVLGLSAKRKIQAVTFWLLTSGSVLLHEIAIFKALSSYYSPQSFRMFFLQASQYKPWFFKSPILEILVLMHLIILSVFLYNLSKYIFFDEKAVN